MKSIRRQLSRNLVLVASIFLGASSAIAAILTMATLQRSFDDGLRERAEAIRSLSEKENGDFSFDFSPEFLAQYNAASAVYFEIWDAKGKALARSPSLAKGDLLYFTSASNDLVYRRLALPVGQGRALGMRYFAEGTNREDPSDALWLEISADARPLDRECGWIVWGTVGTVVFFSLGIFLLVPRVISRGLVSIAELSGEVEGVQANALNGGFSKIDVPSELQPISAALDRLMMRLNESFSRERSFGSDLAHELRTPLAELKILVETARKWPQARDANHDQQVLEIVDQMESLVSRLLFLARLDAGQKPSANESILLAEEIAFAASKYEANMSARGLTLKVDLEPIEIFADRYIFRIIVNNLLQNAAEYGFPETVVNVSGGRLDAGYQLSFSNVSELEPEDLKQIFERFWRKSKSRTDLAQHSGLGLSLVRSAVGVLGWEIRAALRAKEVIFTVMIPFSRSSQASLP